MEQVTHAAWPVAWQWVLLICASIAALGGAISYIHKVLKPVRDLVKRVDKHDKLLDNDNKRLMQKDETDKVLCRSMLALMDHEITGNSIDGLKKARKDLQDYIINR